MHLIFTKDLKKKNNYTFTIYHNYFLFSGRVLKRFFVKGARIEKSALGYV